jgi:hypothetical protein
MGRPINNLNELVDALELHQDLDSLFEVIQDMFDGAVVLIIRPDGITLQEHKNGVDHELDYPFEENDLREVRDVIWDNNNDLDDYVGEN